MKSLAREFSINDILPNIANSEDEGIHTSLFMPIEPNDNRKSLAIKFDSLCSTAKLHLKESMPKEEVEGYLKPLRDAFHAESNFDEHRGFAWFRSAESFYYTALQTPPPSLAVVAGSFHIKPLIHCIATTPTSLALTISAKQLCVYKIVGHQISSKKSYRNSVEDLDPGKRIGMVGQRPRQKESTEKFFRDSVKQMAKEFSLRGKDVAIIGPGALRRRLKNELSMRYGSHIILESAQYSSIEAMTAAVDEAMRRKQSYRDAETAAEVLQRGESSLMTSSLPEIAEAAVQGRVERLLIDPNTRLWGYFDRSSGTVETHGAQTSSEDDCVIDDIAEEVLKKGGDVMFFDASAAAKMPPTMATLRW